MENRFIPDIKQIKRKSKRKYIETKCKIITTSVCKHEYETDSFSGEMYCKKCFIITGVPLLHERSKNKEENLNLIFSSVYDRNKWKEWLPVITGENINLLSDSIWLELAREIPNPFKWHHVYKVFRKYNLQDWWMAFGIYIGLPCVISAKSVALTTKYINLSNDSKYKISYMYLLYKFVQMESKNKEEQFVPIHRSKNWLEKTDFWWKIICKEHGWKYKKSHVAQISWPKERLLKKIAKSVKKFELINKSDENYKKYINYYV